MIQKPYTKNVQDVLKEQSVDEKNGLSFSEAKERLGKFGPNSLEEKKKTPLWRRFLGQFADAMVLILLGAAVVSAIMAWQEMSHEGGGMEAWVDVIVILAIVVINAVLGVYQEGKADKAIEALQKMSSPQAKVMRDGEQHLVPSSELVPGDIVLLDAGDLIPADIRITWQNSLKVEEASLTGESVPVEKNADILLPEESGIGDRENMLFMGTAVTYGRARGVVVDTGNKTELGNIAQKLQDINDGVTPLQRNLTSLGKVLGIVCIAVCILVFAVDKFVQGLDWGESLMTAVSLAVAAIPEGLAAVVTIVLSIGMTRMAARNAIVRKLLAVETLGCVDVICSDKTGTLTQNEMTVTRIYDGASVYEVTGVGYAPEGSIVNEDQSPAKIEAVLERLLLSATLCSDAVNEKNEEGRYGCIGDPTEGALVAVSAKAGFDKKPTTEKYPRAAELPFDSDRKMMTTYHTGIENGMISFTKGAPDIILDRCVAMMTPEGKIPLTPEKKEEILGVNTAFAVKALRVLAFAYREHSFSEADAVSNANFSHEEELVFLGLTGMIDPARVEAKDAIAVCEKAGIRAVMITGDHKDTAVAIAKDLGLMKENDNSMSGAELDKITDDELSAACENTSVYARVSPEHKVRIVSALQKNGHITSMTGDGVNDAMALKTADIGVAMGITGTDVAKNSADMILTDDNFATIVHAIEEGRIIYSNIRKFIGFLLSCNVGEILVIFIISLIPVSVFFPGLSDAISITPLTAIQLLWLNLVTDSFPALALGREKGEPDIMRLPPRKKTESTVNRAMKLSIGVQSVAIFAAVFASFLLGLKVFFPAADASLAAAQASVAGARTMAFATLILAELFRAYSARSEHVNVFKLGIFSNRFMNLAVGFSLLLLFAVIYIPGVNSVFDAIPLEPMVWLPMVGLALIPFVASEIYKSIRYKM